MWAWPLLFASLATGLHLSAYRRATRPSLLEAFAVEADGLDAAASVEPRTVETKAPLSTNAPGYPSNATQQMWSTSAAPRLGSAWYINLNDFTGRRAEMEEAYSRTGMRYMRFPALRPSQQSLMPGGQWNMLYENFQPQRKYELNDPILSGKIRGEIGCIASHLQLLSHIKATGRPGEVYILAEDDYTPAVDFKAKLPTVLSHLPPDWDVVRLDCWEGVAAGVPHKLSKFPQVRPGLFLNSINGCGVTDGAPITGRPECQFCGGTHAVLVSYNKIDKVMALWSGMKGPLFPLDCMLTRPDMKNYCLQWGLFQPVIHLKSRTSIPKTGAQVTQWHLSMLANSTQSGKDA